VVRLLAALILAAAFLNAADQSGWIAEAGGAFSRNREGQISSVDLRASWVTDSDLSDLATLPDLTRLDLSLTRITDRGLRLLKGAPRIEELNLYYAELVTDAGLSAVKGWKHLKRLNLRGAKVTDAALQHLSAVTSLEALDAGYALITDVGLDALASLPNLRQLAIGGNKLTDAGLQPLRQMQGLEQLDLAGSQRTDSGLWSVSLTEAGLDAIATLKNLRHLRLNGTLVSAAGLEKLRALTKLEQLDLERCRRVGDDIVVLLAAFRALKRLDVTGTAISKVGLAKLHEARPGLTILAGESEAHSSESEEPGK
jgi:internalin A